ncbi:unnamed protein product, partial [Ascophyllum nodosum]
QHKSWGTLSALRARFLSRLRGSRLPYEISHYLRYHVTPCQKCPLRPFVTIVLWWVGGWVWTFVAPSFSAFYGRISKVNAGDEEFGGPGAKHRVKRDACFFQVLPAIDTI